MKCEFMYLQVNHHFRQNNSYYNHIEHPRWGATQSVTTGKPVKAGEELFTYYGYKTGYGLPSDFPWYWELQRQVEKEERLEAKRAKLQKKNKLSENDVTEH